MKLLTNEIKIAITAIIAVGLIYVGAIFLKGMKIFDNSATYLVEMDNVDGLAESGEVLANGLNIGAIGKITYNPEKQNLILEINIDQNFQVPKGTTVFVTTPILGAPKINLKLGANENGFLKPGDTLYGMPGTDLMSEATKMLPDIKAMLPKLDSILTNIQTLTADPALEASIQNLEYVTNNLRTSTDKLNNVLGNDVPRLMANVNGVCTNAQTLTDNLNSIDIAGIADNANQTISNAQSITSNLNSALQSKDNTLGLLLNDNSIALQLDSTVVNASMLLQDLREHPKRYVHFSLFGRKEK